MDFLKSAVASAISKGPLAQYSVAERVDLDPSIWTLNNAKKRDNNTKCSIFTFDINANRSRLPLAKNAFRKFRTLRHPGIITLFDSIETETQLYIITERLTPLLWNLKRNDISTETAKWGLWNIAVNLRKTLKFINEEAASVHGCARASSIFTNEAGEWKLAGFDVLSSMKDDDAVIYSHTSLVPDSGRFLPPEVLKSGWDTIKRNPISAVDAYGFGTLIYEVFNGMFSGSDQLSQSKNIPPGMQQAFKRLINGNPKARLSVSHFLDQGRRDGGFFETPLIHTSEGIEGLGLMTDTERAEFLSQLQSATDDFPEAFLKLKILPELLKSVEFGGGGPKVFNLVLKIGSKLSEDEYDSQLTPVLVRLFSSPDRAIRVCLLDNLPLMIDHLSAKIVNDKIFPNMVTGFTDIAPVVREQTVKSVLTVITKLSDRTINGELLKYLAKTANDEQPGIRTNTTICLGKIARDLSSNTRTKVLVAAFTRSLRDPFVHSRNAALMALAATSDVFTEDDSANKILPSICPSLLDKEQIVRDQANKTLDVFLLKVRKHARTLPEASRPATPNTAENAVAAPRIGTAANDSGWAGWAISSFTNKLASADGQIEAKSNGVSAVPSGKRPGISGVTLNTSNPAAKLKPASNASTERYSPNVTPEFEEPDAWGGWDDRGTNEDADTDAHEVEDAWGVGDDLYFDAPASSITTTTSTTPSKTTTPVTKVTNYDDNGEPDFAGWLKAQSQSKSKAPLPKGLAKPSTNTIAARPKQSKVAPAAKTSKTTSVADRTSAIQPQPKTAPRAQAHDEDVYDGWGDEWE